MSYKLSKTLKYNFKKLIFPLQKLKKHQENTLFEFLCLNSNKTFWMIIRHCVADSFVDYLELDKWMCKHLKKGYTKNRQISCQVIGSKKDFFPFHDLVYCKKIPPLVSLLQYVCSR